MSNTFTYRMPAGVVGDVTRKEQSTIETQIMDPNTPVLAYGVCIKYVSGLVQPIASGDAATVVEGLLARPFPVQGGVADAFGSIAPNKALPCDVMKRGYMTVQQVDFATNAATKGAQMYVQVTADTGLAVGSIVIGSDGGKAVAIANCFAMGPADANGLLEVAYNI